MSRLKQVQEIGQKVAEAIATVLHIEVEIIDTDLVRVAGTGRVKGDVGMRLPRGLVNKHVLQSGRPIFIHDPGFHQICKTCPLSGDCFYKAYIVYPIHAEDQIIGTMTLIAFNAAQKNILASDYHSHLEFLSQMADLISSKVLEIEMFAEKTVMANQLAAVVDSVHEGVLAVNSLGTITHFNTSAEKMLGLSREQVVGKPLKHYLAALPLMEVITTGKGYSSKEVFLNLGKRRLHLVATAQPIKAADQRIVGAVASFRDYSETEKFVWEIAHKQHSITFEELIGTSKNFTEVKQEAQKIAASNSTVLIIGESGTGKEVFARAIHAASSHSHKPFIVFNCGAIPESLLETELFGYVEGAFPGARRGGRPGQFELANGGTVFLDEIDKISLYIQARLLAVLQTKQVERVGGSQPIPVDVRVIAAVSGNLKEKVNKGQFREDLYYQLSVIPLLIPALRERPEDIPLLLNHYLHRYAGLLGKDIRGFTKESLKACTRYPWPGNVRELINSVEYAINLEESPYITLSSLPARIREDDGRRTVLEATGLSLERIPTLEEIEKAAIEQALERYGWSEEGKKKAAKALGISRATIYRKLQKYGLCNKAGRSNS